MANAFAEVLEECGFAAKWKARGRDKGMKQGLEEGREEGREQGRREGLKEAARRLQKYGMGPIEVGEVLELPLSIVVRSFEAE